MMKKAIMNLSVICTLFLAIYFLPQGEVKAQSDCTSQGCWNTITMRAGWPAMYCGTCTYIDNSMGVAEGGTATCMDCGPGIG